MRKMMLVIVAALMVACGGGGSGASAAVAATRASPSALPAGSSPRPPAVKARDACSLVTDAEASSLLGGPANHHANPPSDASNGNGVVVTKKGCHYDLITSDQSGHQIQIAVYVGADRTYFDDRAIGRSGPPAIPGLGDAASGDAIHVFVFAKGTMLQIYGSLAADTGLQQVARMAIAKL